MDQGIEGIGQMTRQRIKGIRRGHGPNVTPLLYKLKVRSRLIDATQELR